jgi:flagellar L-ring protein precursor FlgH
LIVGFAFTICACSITPSTITQNQSQAIASRPVSQPTPGSIYSVSNYQSMFEGRRARAVGDILTIYVSEETTTSKKGDGSASKKGTANATASDLFGITINPTYAFKNDSSYESKAENNNYNKFSGYISTTVVDVKPNGYLVVTGEKQVAFDQGIEFVRISGTVNPDMISTGNVVQSNTVADARIEYRTNTTLDWANLGTMMNRFFLSIVPF